LEDHQIKKYYTYGGEKVFFTKDEMTTIKTFGQPGTARALLPAPVTGGAHVCVCVVCRA
jgi:hypothetical protein